MPGTPARAARWNPIYMRTLPSPLRPALIALVALACALLTACADNPPRQSEVDYRSRPSSSTQGASRPAEGSGQRLTIESGEGEQLNLPWFIQDTQDWINRN